MAAKKERLTINQMWWWWQRWQQRWWHGGNCHATSLLLV